jgi:hypothetical protein
MEINLKQIEDSAKDLGIPNDFRDPRLHFMFDVICGALFVLKDGKVMSEKLFKDRVLSKRDNLIEYYKALINFSHGF